MCGICGVWNYATREPVDRARLERMRDTLVHRGPDDAGTHFDDAAGLGLGFRRLSIIDPSPAGHQPMGNEDGSVWIVFNGEAYNFLDLRPQLEAHGHRFRSHSDTEVVLHLYEQQGTRCVESLNGMFGLAIWDAPRRRLFLARDRIGKKPLYYYDDGRRILFASELKAILADPTVARDLDWRAVGQFFAVGNVTGADCIIYGVRKLPAGHRLVCADGRVTTERYWDWLPAFRRVDRTRSEAEWIAALRATLTEAVRRRMISDVPLGAFLSGGVDSSAVVATMAGLSAQPVRTFSIGFADRRYDETPYAREVAQRFGTEHHELVVEPEAVESVLPRLVRQYDEPFADSSALPTYYVSKLAREHVTVCLSGDGGDEACAGYDRYDQALREGAVDVVPQWLRRLVLWPFSRLPAGTPGRSRARRFMQDATGRYVTLMRFMSPEHVTALLTPEAAARVEGDGAAAVATAFARAGDLDALSRVQYTDGTVYLPDDILVKVDRASMLNSLEVRCPLLDYEFLELMAAVPPALRRANGGGKALLKRAFRGVLPDAVLDRPKMGFGVPLERWFRDDLATFVRATLCDARTAQRGIFSRRGVETLIRGGASASIQLSSHLWQVLVFELWCRAYLDAP